MTLAVVNGVAVCVASRQEQKSRASAGVIFWSLSAYCYCKTAYCLATLPRRGRWSLRMLSDETSRARSNFCSATRCQCLVSRCRGARSLPHKSRWWLKRVIVVVARWPRTVVGGDRDLPRHHRVRHRAGGRPHPHAHAAGAGDHLPGGAGGGALEHRAHAHRPADRGADEPAHLRAEEAGRSSRSDHGALFDATRSGPAGTGVRAMHRRKWQSKPLEAIRGYRKAPRPRGDEALRDPPREASRPQMLITPRSPPTPAAHGYEPSHTAAAGCRRTAARVCGH